MYDLKQGSCFPFFLSFSFCLKQLLTLRLFARAGWDMKLKSKYFKDFLGEFVASDIKAVSSNSGIICLTLQTITTWLTSRICIKKKVFQCSWSRWWKNYSYMLFPQFSVNLLILKIPVTLVHRRVCWRLGPRVVCDVTWRSDFRTERAKRRGEVLLKYAR